MDHHQHHCLACIHLSCKLVNEIIVNSGENPRLVVHNAIAITMRSSALENIASPKWRRKFGVFVFSDFGSGRRTFIGLHCCTWDWEDPLIGVARNEAKVQAFSLDEALNRSWNCALSSGQTCARTRFLPEIQRTDVQDLIISVRAHAQANILYNAVSSFAGFNVRKNYSYEGGCIHLRIYFQLKISISLADSKYIDKFRFKNHLNRCWALLNWRLVDTTSKHQKVQIWHIRRHCQVRLSWAYWIHSRQ